MPPTSPAPQPAVESDRVRLLRELAAVILIIAGLIVIVAGGFHVHPGLGWMLTGAAAVAGGYTLGKE